jgi:hypothetical protein
LVAPTTSIPVLALERWSSNTAVGTAALLLNTTGGNNTAVGTDALVYNDTGSFNTAIGDRVLFNNTSGDHKSVAPLSKNSARWSDNRKKSTLSRRN